MIFSIGEDRDLIIDGDDFKMASGLDETAQCVRAALWAWKGEAAFDLDHGADYKQILEKNVSDQDIMAVIQEAITQEQTIVNIIDMTVARHGRMAAVTYTASSNNGVLESEVQIG